MFNLIKSSKAWWKLGKSFPCLKAVERQSESLSIALRQGTCQTHAGHVLFLHCVVVNDSPYGVAETLILTSFWNLYESDQESLTNVIY